MRWHLIVSFYISCLPPLVPMIIFVAALGLPLDGILIDCLYHCDGGLGYLPRGKKSVLHVENGTLPYILKQVSLLPAPKTEILISLLFSNFFSRSPYYLLFPFSPCFLITPLGALARAFQYTPKNGQNNHLTFWIYHFCKDCEVFRGPLRPPWGSMKLIFTGYIHLVSLEKFHHKPMGMYDGGLYPLLYIPIRRAYKYCSPMVTLIIIIDNMIEKVSFR